MPEKRSVSPKFEVIITVSAYRYLLLKLDVSHLFMGAQLVILSLALEQTQKRYVGNSVREQRHSYPHCPQEGQEA